MAAGSRAKLGCCCKFLSTVVNSKSMVLDWQAFSIPRIGWCIAWVTRQVAMPLSSQAACWWQATTAFRYLDGMQMPSYWCEGLLLLPYGGQPA